MVNFSALDDLYGYYYPPFWQTTVGIVLIGSVGALLLGMTVWFILRRRKRKQTAWEWALARLTILDPHGIESKEDYKKLYFSMTETIKQYLAKRYEWKTRDKTDDELIEYLIKKNFEPEQMAALKKLLDGAVLVKFADASILKMQALDDLAAAQELIKKTIPNSTR